MSLHRFGWMTGEVQAFAREVAERELTEDELDRVEEQLRQPHGIMEQTLKRLIAMVTETRT